MKDLYFGEALYYAYQDSYFDAIARLDTELAQYHGLDEPHLSSLYDHIDTAEFSVGDFEVRYRMHNRASRAIRTVIDGNVPEAVRNEALYRLAEIQYQKRRYLDALHTMEHLKGEVPGKLRYEAPFLRAQIYMATGRFAEAARLFSDLENAEHLTGYAGYNLAVALLKAGREEAGIAQLDKVGRTAAQGSAAEAIRDKANLVLGYRLLEKDMPVSAAEYLRRVRLSGPFSNKALLGSGWAASADGTYERALVPWAVLSSRNVTDRSVQEALLGLPYAYSKLTVHGRAAILYGEALQAYNGEVDRLDASIASIREGKFLEALEREEAKRKRLWLIDLRELPDGPETYYLTELMASHEFQEALKNYLDLSRLQKRLERWGDDLAAYEEMIALRAAYYEPLFVEIETRFRTLDSKIKLRLAQREKLARKFKQMLVSPQPDLLVNAEERKLLQRIGRLEKNMHLDGSGDAGNRERIDRLEGIIRWDIHTEYDRRFDRAARNLRELEYHIDTLKESYDSFIRTRQAATHSYKGYGKTIERLRNKIRQTRIKLKNLRGRQGHVIEVMAVNELERRRSRIEEYRIKARFAMAESYDRATKENQEQRKESHAE